MTAFPGAKLMQVVEWGYPTGVRRPVPSASKAFSTVHITANLATAENEAAWRQRDPALQNSATFFVNRDGSVVQLLGDPLHMDPWANGDVKDPDVSNPRIAAMVRDGVNANERTLVAIENVGNEVAWGKVPGGHPITPAQEAANARIIAFYHALAGVPVSRETVIGHYQLNSVSRQNCPSTNKAILDRIVALAQPQEDDMPNPPLRYKPELWRTKASGTDLRRDPVMLTTNKVGLIPPGTVVFTVAESEDGVWRLAVAGDPEGLFWVVRGAMDPLVQGGDPALHAGIASVVNASMVGQPVPNADAATVRELTEALARQGTAIAQAVQTLTAVGGTP